MTVSELIDELMQYPPDSPVKIFEDEEGWVEIEYMDIEKSSSDPRAVLIW